jgi:hypothetical protein
LADEYTASSTLTGSTITFGVDGPFFSADANGFRCGYGVLTYSTDGP